MGVFNVTTGVGKEPGRPFCFFFECGIDTLEALSATLSEGKIVLGSKLRVTDDGRGGLLIQGRDEIALGAAQAGLLQVPIKRLWEPQD